MRENPSFFDFAAEVGLTKHIGGVKATDELLEVCKITGEMTVLDVGCGTGATACYIAKRYGCRVVGVDILERMVERSRERAQGAHLEQRLEFRTADAQELPFGDNSFDIVMTESVTAFPKDKQQAVREYARVAKPGGYVGLNESTWLRLPPPPEMVEWASQDLGADVTPLSSAEWSDLLRNAGLVDILARVREVDVREESRGIVQRYGCLGFLGILVRMIALYSRNPDYRNFVQKVGHSGVVPKNINEYFGYGLYIGRKP